MSPLVNALNHITPTEIVKLEPKKESPVAGTDTPPAPATVKAKEKSNDIVSRIKL
jgi:hypothetical protein